MRHRDLLAAIADLGPIQVEGTFERHTSLRWTELNASPSGGRWGAPRAYEVLYLGRPRDSVVIEAYRHLVDDELDDAQQLAASVLERRVITCTVTAPNILDLRHGPSQEAVGLSKAQLLSDVGDTSPAKPSEQLRINSAFLASSRRQQAVSGTHWRCSPQTLQSRTGRP